ncbi:MAG: hypothetical protein RR540_05150 [Oscillospiraceae bacterium]
MDNYSIIITIVLSVVGTIVILGIIVPLLQKKGVKLDNLADNTKVSLETIQKIFEAIKPLLPQSGTLDIVSKIIELAKSGAGNAEQLYKTGTIEACDRKKSARQFVTDSLKLAKIDINDDINKIIDDSIESAVNSLPSCHI